MKKIKIPSLFNDVFTEKRFNKKILDKIYVPKDKEFVLSLYEKNDDGNYILKNDLDITKADCKRLKTLAKDFKKQKGRIKLLPLAITAGIIACIISIFVLLKNPLAKWGITSGIEAVAGAKCDVENVDLQFFNSKLSVTGLAVANKDSPMTNIVDVSSIVIDFDLVQLLKGRFVVDELSAKNVQTGTSRTVSGALPLKKQKQKEQKTPLTKEEKEAMAVDFIKAQTGIDVNKVKDNFGKDGMMNMLNTVNPETIVNSFYEQMASPAVIASLEPEAKNIVASWQETSADISQKVQGFATSAQSLVATDLSNIKDKATLQKLLNDINVVVNNGEAIKGAVEEAGKKVERDSNTIKTISQNVQNAVTNDINLLNNEIAKIKNLNLADSVRLFTGELDVPVYNLIKQYMPLLQSALAKVNEFQNSSASKKESTPKKEQKGRAKGRTVEYRRDNVPQFLVRLADVSYLDGKTGMQIAGKITNISNDCNKLDKPVAIEASIKKAREDIGSLVATLDMRTKRAAKAFEAKVETGNFSVANLTVPGAQNLVALPSLSGLAKLGATLAIDTDTSFDIDFTAALSDVLLAVKPFEPAFAYSLYTRAIENIATINLEAMAGFSPLTAFNLNVWSDIDKILKDNITNLFNSELAVIRSELETLAKAEIEKIVSPLQAQLGDFVDLEKLLKGDLSLFADMKQKAEEKQKEIEEKLKKMAEDAVKGAIEQSGHAETISGVLNAIQSPNISMPTSPKTTNPSVDQVDMPVSPDAPIVDGASTDANGASTNDANGASPTDAEKKAQDAKDALNKLKKLF